MHSDVTWLFLHVDELMFLGVIFSKWVKRHLTHILFHSTIFVQNRLYIAYVPFTIIT